MNLNAMLIDGPCNGQVIQVPWDTNVWEVAVADPARYTVRHERDFSPFSPAFYKVCYTRMPIATPTSINTTPSGFTLFVWDGRER